MGCEGVCGFRKRKPCVVCHEIPIAHSLCAGFFHRDERDLPSWVVHPLQSFPGPLLHRPSHGCRVGGPGCAVHEGTVDAHGAAGDFPQSWRPRAESPLVTETRGSKSPVWKKCPTALRPTSQNLSVCCVCVCVSIHTPCVWDTRSASFFKGRLYIYI